MPEEDRRSFSLGTITGVFMPGGRALDERLRQFGFAVVVALLLLGMNYKFMSDEREDRKTQTEALTKAFSTIAASLTSVEIRMSGMEGGLEWMRGAAVGRLKCPDLQCAPCVCPPARVTVAQPTVPAVVPRVPDVRLKDPDLIKTPEDPTPQVQKQKNGFWNRNR